ncbi:MAG: TetR/AcrR family transcriptional regulator [Parvibaculum sp.]|uniref:TetR/AcrR family transcriptional regulator n=1 Tax=Parvibaculum sp. TaxID=2024848 RepID=UPI0025F73637|nr:TetR/AcrR family transcriptional regulator [Parvibaculum sp.]MCE9651258.1 TetR/AcrR family transcriptional regulator [Parvibaculum sp.]
MAKRPKKQTPAPRGRPKRTPQAVGEERRRILEAAEKLFAQGGYEGVSMRAVAKEAGCSPAALYTLFPHKRALLRNIWEEAFSALDDALEKAARGKRKPIETLKRLGRAFVDFWLAHPDHFRAIFLIEDKVVEPGELYFVDTSQSLERLVGLFHKAAVEAISAGEIARDDPKMTVEIIFCALHGVTAGLISMPEYGWERPSRLAGRMTEVLMAGLAAT